MSELEYTEKGWRHTLDTTRHHRANTWNYRGKGIYHMTLVVEKRYPLFGHITGDTAEQAAIELNEYGKRVSRLLHDLPAFYHPKGIALKIIAIQVMPDHMHFVLQVLEPMNRSVGEIIRSFKSTCTSIYKREYYSPTNPDDNNIAKNDNPLGDFREVAPPQAVVDFARIFASRGSIWLSDPAHYHERILLYKGQLQHMIDYVHDNPRRRWLKHANPDLFRIRQGIKVGNTICTALGQIFLINHPMRAVIQCSRSLTQPEIDTLCASCLRQAAEGMVFISPAIAEGEKQICRALREAGYPLIILLSEGFPPPDSPHYRFFKPQGVYFEACAAGKLLLIEPSPELLSRPDIEAIVTAKAGKPLPHNTKRYRFLALNALAMEISTHE